MSIDAIAFKAPSGFAGQLSRPTAPFTNISEVTSAITNFGDVVDLTSGKVQPITSGSTVVFGIAVRAFPIQSQVFPNAAIGAGAYAANTVADILKNGYIIVKVVGTANVGDTAYVVTNASTAGHPVGSIVASSTGAIAIGAVFNTAANSEGFAELHVQIA